MPGLPPIWYIAPIGAISALSFAFLFFKMIQRSDPGNPRMQEIAGYVREGAFAYLKQQYKGVSIFFAVVLAIFFYMVYAQDPGSIDPLGFLSAGHYEWSGWIHRYEYCDNGIKPHSQACSESLNKGLIVAFGAGSVMGLVVVGLALFDMSAWWLILRYVMNYEFQTIAVVMLSFGMGASTQALFARLGGGIYTKAADVGADLVGKVEADIPEDDPRNPATIADNVGDNVGDVAGMGADLYESYAGSILATAALGMSAVLQIAARQPSFAANMFNFIAAPMILAGIGALLSIIGIFLVSTKEDAGMSDLMKSLNKSVWVSSILIAVASFSLLGHSCLKSTILAYSSPLWLAW
jgi:K(+)-stimulated pyrophosphate-energized sodium pump